MAISELDQLKHAARETWGAGDYGAVAALTLWPVGQRIVDRLEVRAGEDVLDVACGTGNAALRAAQAGARVTGLDLTPRLLEVGRELAADAGVEVEWVEGDAEDLPFEAERFDVVISVFGCMFAPRHEVTARELARVLRPGGRLAVTAWTPDGSVGRFFATMARHLPPPPGPGAPPLLWGDEAHVRALFEGTGVELEFAHEQIQFPQFPSPEEELEWFTARFGPMIKARQHAEAAGCWDALRADIIAQYARQEPAEYLVVTGRRS